MKFSGVIRALCVIVMLFVCGPLAAENPDPDPTQSNSPPAGSPSSPSPPAQPSSLDDTLDASEASAEMLPALKWNELEGKYMSIRFGFGLLYEYDAFAQNEESKEQFVMHSTDKLRDFRFLLKGRLKFFKRPVTYTMGIMWDSSIDEWVARQTGIMFPVPKIGGELFIGRTKEGFSLNKVMVGYSLWTMERFTMSDATLPILADGVKWYGYNEKAKMIWNVGFYGDWMSQNQAFSTYDHQVSGRIAWVPIMSAKTDKVFHLGLGIRYGVPKNQMLQPRSRPESNPAPYFVDTGSFAAKRTKMLGPEVYYRKGPLLVGSEYFIQMVDAPASKDPLFHGGDVSVTWVATGEVRPYNTRGGFFDMVSPKRPVFQGGPGAWELVGRLSYIDLDGGTLRGGKFWRITPMVNWYLSDNVRLEFVYGYGSLNRFELNGKTQFFQTRLQLQL